ncbi:MAG: hypothetical protein EHM48_09485 [Planctomycetaceae bacterium]|nr:MAG: hypothetical protein EHM48_09485 [Planctomycetaceae bacterium]
MELHEPHRIVAVHITDRLKEAIEVQKVLTCFGANIRTRLGLNEVEKAHSGPAGLILLEVTGTAAKATELQAALCKIEGVEVKTIVFEH